MPDPANRLREAATRGLESNPELHLQGRRYLDERIDPDTADERTAERLEQCTPVSRWRRGRLTLFILTVIVSGLTLTDSYRNLEPSLHHNWVQDVWPSWLPNASGSGIGNASPADRLLLHGDETISDPVDRFRALWQSDSDNAAYYADYVIRHIAHRDAVPEDLAKVSGRIDPDNGWFDMVIAAHLAADSTAPPASAKGQADAEWMTSLEITDPERFEKALEFVRSAAAKPRFTSYQSELLGDRIKRFHRHSDLAARVNQIHYLASQSIPLDTFEHLGILAQVRARTLAERNDAEGLKSFSAAWDKLLRNMLEQHVISMHESLLYVGLTLQSANLLEQAANALDLDSVAKRWNRFEEAMTAARKHHPPRTFPPARQFSTLAALQGGFQSGRVAPKPPTTPADLTPSRNAEHELASRQSSMFAWGAVLIGCIGIAAYRFRAGPLVRQLSRELQPLFRPVDWLLVIAGGVALPFTLMYLHQRLIPTGRWDWAPNASDYFIPYAHFLALTGAVMLATTIIAGSRLAARGAVFGFTRPRLRFTALALLACLLTPVVIGWSDGWPAVTASALASITIIALLILAARALFSRESRLLFRITLSRILVPVYALTLLALACGISVHHQLERDWISQDEMLALSPDAPSMSRAEYEAANANQNKLLELLIATREPSPAGQP